jgi:hypothetical protein
VRGRAAAGTWFQVLKLGGPGQTVTASSGAGPVHPRFGFAPRLFRAYVETPKRSCRVAMLRARSLARAGTRLLIWVKTGSPGDASSNLAGPVCSGWRSHGACAWGAAEVFAQEWWSIRM